MTYDAPRPGPDTGVQENIQRQNPLVLLDNALGELQLKAARERSSQGMYDYVKLGSPRKTLRVGRIIDVNGMQAFRLVTLLEADPDNLLHKVMENITGNPALPPDSDDNTTTKAEARINISRPVATLFDNISVEMVRRSVNGRGQQAKSLFAISTLSPNQLNCQASFAPLKPKSFERQGVAVFDLRSEALPILFLGGKVYIDGREIIDGERSQVIIDVIKRELRQSGTNINPTQDRQTVLNEALKRYLVRHGIKATECHVLC